VELGVLRSRHSDAKTSSEMLLLSDIEHLIDGYEYLVVI
jgi:hypothetical protein